MLAAIMLLQGMYFVKMLWPKRAKPKLDSVNISYGYSDNDRTPYVCQLVINNFKGKRDCTVLGVDVYLDERPCSKGGGVLLITEHDFEPRKALSTEEVVNVEAGRAEKVQITGRCEGLDIKDKTLAAEVHVRINTGKMLTKSVTAYLNNRIA